MNQEGPGCVPLCMGTKQAPVRMLCKACSASKFEGFLLIYISSATQHSPNLLLLLVHPVEALELIAPRIPTGPALAGEQLGIGTGAQSLDPLVLLIRFAGVLASRRDD